MSPSYHSSSLSSLSSSTAHNGDNIEVRLNSHHNFKIYGCGAPVHGEVVITLRESTSFDFVSILLMGISKTCTGTAMFDRHVSHVFLKVNMPIAESAYPTSRTFEAGRTYKIPVDFVIPMHLTTNACSHKTQFRAVYDQHTRMPPSMGSWGRDDLSTARARIEYTTKAYIVRRQIGLSCCPAKVMEASHLIRVLPVSVEDPPLHVTTQDETYTLTTSQKVRKNIVSASQGLITISAHQPAAIRISTDGDPNSRNTVFINLTFDAVAPEIPAPNVSHVSGKLQVTTWFSSVPMEAFPNLADSRRSFATQQQYAKSIPLFFSSLENVTPWCAQELGVHEAEICLREHLRPVEEASEQKIESESNQPLRRHATLQVPFTIAANSSMLLPTFHSCLISRTHSIKLRVHFSDAKFDLHVPVQVIVERSEGEILQEAEPPSFDFGTTQGEQDPLQPRTMRQPASEFRGTSVLPGYAGTGRAFGTASS
ncbi:arrestin domain-containing protein [Colletotrichum karsti]|uniref:Arrestin domain-containing protein n=1 Tax=Colletotrichum karsti TaxID=1095194 RepID=A0A9P6IDV4_9PEZI|nr:arrestin domain-containing protein [Colletotrichum karsti]KAF9878736.1 arrestin domain-containing protein [Colletotrichum karsti]